MNIKERQMTMERRVARRALADGVSRWEATQRVLEEMDDLARRGHEPHCAPLRQSTFGHLQEARRLYERDVARLRFYRRRRRTLRAGMAAAVLLIAVVVAGLL